MKVQFTTFKNFAKIIKKGCLLRLANFRFFPDESGKPRWILILNNKPPSSEEDKIFYVPLKRNWANAIKYCEAPRTLVKRIKDKSLDRESAYDLSQIFTFEAGQLFLDHQNGKLDYRSSLDTKTIKLINSHLKRFLKSDYSKTLSPLGKKMISP